MKLKKLLVGTLSTIMLVSALSVSAAAEDTKYATGYLSWADGIASYYWGDDDNAGIEKAPKVDIVGNDTYTIDAKVYNATLDDASGEEIGGPVKGLAVLTVDLKLDDKKAEWADLYPDARIELVKVEIGGESISYDLNKLRDTPNWDATKELSGGTNILENSNLLRQNIYNSWGLGGGAFDPDAEKEYDSISVTFKVTGLPDSDNSGTNDDTGASGGSTDDKTTDSGDNKGGSDNASTGIESVAAVAAVALIAGGIVVGSRKRK